MGSWQFSVREGIIDDIAGIPGLQPGVHPPTPVVTGKSISSVAKMCPTQAPRHRAQLKGQLKKNKSVLLFTAVAIFFNFKQLVVPSEKIKDSAPRGGSAVKSVSLFLQRTQVQFPTPTWQLTSCVTPVPEDPTPSFVLHRHCTHVIHR